MVESILQGELPDVNSLDEISAAELGFKKFSRSSKVLFVFLGGGLLRGLFCFSFWFLFFVFFCLFYIIFLLVFVFFVFGGGLFSFLFFCWFLSFLSFWGVFFLFSFFCLLLSFFLFVFCFLFLFTCLFDSGRFQYSRVRVIFSPSVLMHFWFYSSIPSVVSIFLFFLITRAHFSIPNSIPIFLYFLLGFFACLLDCLFFCFVLGIFLFFVCLFFLFFRKYLDIHILVHLFLWFCELVD